MNKLNIILSKCMSVFLLIFVSVLTASAQQPSETPPPPGEAPTLSLPEVKEMTLPNGLKVVVVEKKGVPLVTVSLLVKSGAEIEPEKKAGLANMTANLLTKGTEFRNATDIASQIEFLGGSIDSGASWSSSTISVNVMKDKLGRALSIMSDSVIRPTFPIKEVQLLKKQTLDGFNVSLKQPGTILSFVASRYSFDEHTISGTPQTIATINQKDIVDFHKQNYLPEYSVLIFTGDISEKQAFGYAKLFFGGWEKFKQKPTNMSLNEVNEVSESQKKYDGVIRRFLVIDLPNSGQAAVGYAKKLNEGRIICESEDTIKNNCLTSSIYYPATVLNSVLGGGYSSRLNQEIRLKRGLSYGAGSGFAWRGFDTNFNANTQTKNESAAEVAELIKIEVEKLVKENVSEDEIIPRKAAVTGGFGLGIQTTNGLANRLIDLYTYNISANELNSYMDNVGKITDKQIKDFASDNLTGGDMIIVGDAKLFMEDLKKRFPDQKIELIKASDLDLNKSNLRKR